MKKKFKLTSIAMLLFLSFMITSCLATSAESGNMIEYVDSYEDYEQIMNEANTGYSQDDLKDGYLSYKEFVADYYRDYKRDEVIKARVIDVQPVKEEYEVDEYYYSISKYEVQPIKVQIIEGEHIGKEYEINYLLTGDSLNNIRYSELQKGDIIFVGFYTDEVTGEVVADITNAGSNVERFSVIICFAIISACLLMVYGRKKGLLTILILLLVLDFCLVIIPNMGYDGEGFINGGIAFIVLLTFTNAITKLGLNKKSLVATFVSLGVTCIAVLLLLVANYLTRTVGVTFEVAAVAENVILGNMNFEHLYIIITMIITSMAITNVACKSILKIQETTNASLNKRMDVCKDVLDETALSTVVTLATTYIPNHLLLLTNKYTTAEILNSEILVSELIRIFIVLIAISLTVPVVAFAVKSKEEQQDLTEA